MQRLSVNYVGRVQGVGFRATTRAVAREHMVSGWVRNEPDGSVQVEAQGSPERVEAFLGALRGRMQRFIQTSQASPVPVVAGETTFEIRP